MIIYGLKSCDTCRKARAALPSATFVDVRDTPVPPEVLATALTTFGDAIVNRRSTTWRQLDEEARKMSPSDLIKSHPTVMKRPLIVNNEQLFLGWGPDVQAALS